MVREGEGGEATACLREGTVGHGADTHLEVGMDREEGIEVVLRLQDGMAEEEEAMLLLKLVCEDLHPLVRHLPAMRTTARTLPRRLSFFQILGQGLLQQWASRLKTNISLVRMRL